MSRSLSLTLVGALALIPPLLAGCSSTPGRGFTLFPQGHKLLDTTEEIRWANARTLQIPRELEKEPLPSYVVEPGDVLLVQPVELESPVRLPGDQPILPDGTINLGKYGRLQVAGKTLPEIEGMARSAVAAVETQTKDVGFISVRLVARQSKVYYVLGEVNSPGAFQLNGRETVLDALMAAGGLTDAGSRDNIILSRPTKPNCCRVVLPVCYRHIVQLGDTTTNYQIAPGDRIFVPTRTFLESFCHGKYGKNPCKCGGHTPCNLPPYQGGPCPEDHSTGAPGFAPAAPATSPVLPPAAAPAGPAPQTTPKAAPAAPGPGPGSADGRGVAPAAVLGPIETDRPVPVPPLTLPSPAALPPR